MTTTTLERITSVPITYEFDATALTEKVSGYTALKINGIEDADGYKAVRNARLDLKRIRTSIEARRKELKQDALEYGRKVDEAAKALTGLVEPTERQLESEEKRIDAEKERIKREAEEAKKREFDRRVGLIVATGFCPMSPSAFHPDKMLIEEFDAILADATEKKREADEEAARQKALKERAEAEERAKREAEERRLAEERARIAKEREELEARRREQEAERLRIEAERVRLEAEERQREEAAAEELRTREATVPVADQVVSGPATMEPEGEIVDAEYAFEPSRADVVHSGPRIIIPPKPWRSTVFLQSDALAAAERALETIEDYKPEFRRSFVLAVIEELRVRADELKENEGGADSA